MQKFRNLEVDFLINRRVALFVALVREREHRASCFEASRRNFFPHVARVACFRAVDADFLVPSIPSVWLHSFRFEL